jgi:phospholipid/cholesterol/gamma-HCH transport system substrate-binding protein
VRSTLSGDVWRLAVFSTVCVLGIGALVAVFAQLRFDSDTTYRAQFSNVTGLKAGNFVRIAGVEVGKVESVRVQPDATVLVDFNTDTTVALTEGTRVAIRYDDLIGGRYLALEEGPGPTTTIRPGATIGMDHTSPALDLDALIGGFRPLFRALDPDQVNVLSTQLIKAFQGQGATIGSFLTQTAALTAALADRDQLIGEVITNLHTVLGTISDQSTRFDTAVTSLSELAAGLAEHRSDLSASLAHGNHAAATIADLLDQTRPALRDTLAQTDRTAGLVVADHDYVDNLLNTLPDTYQKLARQGIYGDFFNFYLCEAALKVNGKGGQPVYIKLAGQDSGRCTPQ